MPPKKRKSKSKKQQKRDKLTGELTYRGHPISPEFEEMIREAASAANKNPQEILDNPKYESVIDNLLEKNKATLFRTSKSILNLIHDTGKPIVTITDGEHEEKMTAQKAINKIISFEQKTKKESDIVYLGIKTVQYLNGELKIFIPAFSSLHKGEEKEYIEDFMQSENTEYLIYN